MGKLKKVELVAKTKMHFVVRGKYDDENGALLVINFYQQGTTRAMTVARVQNKEFTSLQDVILERGVYEARVQKCINPRERVMEGPEEVYPSPVMAGEKYPVHIATRAARMYGHDGTEVEVRSDELPLSDRDVYYTLQKPDRFLRSIKYRVPMGGGNLKRFFVADMAPDQIEFKSQHEDMLNLIMNG